MTLIKSISGIRGTIGGKEGENFTPQDVVKFTSAYCHFIQRNNFGDKTRIVVGRDARISGELVSTLVISTLNAMGADVVNLGLTTTPTVEIAVTEEKAAGGIIITASHNPRQWNALKLLNHRGEFISANDGEEVLRIAESGDVQFAGVDELGSCKKKDYLEAHVRNILELPLVNVESIRNAGFRIAVDAVNSTGGIYVPHLLRELGVAEIHELYCTPDGNFPHNPEPLPEHLTEIANLVKEKKCDLGIVVDPDVDRLALVCEDGSMFGEEYSLVAIADYVLSQTPGSTVSNLSSTRALRDITEKHGQRYEASAVGEVNVVEKMKELNAVIGGEGNGGIIYPEIHYGRDALVGIALFLSHLAVSGKKISEMRNSYPQYAISKNKIELKPEMNIDAIMNGVKEIFPEAKVNTIDGVKLDFENEWVHLRKSNTEPIIRIIAESTTKQKADDLAFAVMKEIQLLAETV